MDSLFETLPSKSSAPTTWTFEDKQSSLYKKYTQGQIIEDKLDTHNDKPKEIQKEESNVNCVQTPVNAEFHKEKTEEELKKITTDKKTKKDKVLPSHIITELCNNSYINYEYIKQSMIDFISKKEFQKMFGVKKTSEVLKGITEDKWNKSFVTFVSFIFNKVFIYLKKEVSFYPLDGKQHECITL